MVANQRGDAVETERAWRDPNLDRKQGIMVKTLAEQVIAFPMVSLFEISLSGLCNRQCPFCPRADHSVYPNTKEYIEQTLHAKMMRELGELDYTGLIVYSGYSEPLLHRGIVEIVKEARTLCPKAKIEVYTNGDSLKVGMIRKLIGAGLNTILVSLYDGPEQIEKFTTMRREAGVTDQQMILRERYLLEKGEGMHLSNRAGTIDFKQMHVEPLKQSLKRQCFLPFYMMMVDHTGEVFLCSHDWIKKFVVGDLRKQTVLEVWNSKKMKAARESLAEGNRCFGPCVKCDVDGTKIGKDHFERWMAYYQAVQVVRERG